MADDKRKEADRTGARDPGLKPENQGVTQDEANKRGDLNDPQNKVELMRQRFESGVPVQGENPSDIGEHDPPEAAEHGGAETDQAASGQTQGGGDKQAARDQRQSKPKG